MGRTAEKETAEDSRGISIWWLKKHNYLTGYKSGTINWTWDGDESSKSSITFIADIEAMQVRFRYTQEDYWSGEKRQLDYTHNLVSTPCHFGGFRYWFRCGLTRNGRFCGRRVGVLYKAYGSLYWGCRHCHNIGYETQRISRHNAISALLVYSIYLDRIEQKIKRWYWKGRPTRKHKRLLKFASRFEAYGML